MKSRSLARCRTVMCLVVSAVLAPTVVLAQPPNDECSQPASSGFGASPIVGEGTWTLDDLLTATLSTTPPPIGGTTSDVWFQWRSTFTGTAQINVCGVLLYAQVFAGCDCPPSGQPIAFAGPAACQQQFPVSCGQCYLVRAAASAYPQNPHQGLTIIKASGQECPPGPAQSCSECCAKSPQFTDASFATLAGGRFAVETHFGQSPYALRLLDLDMPASCPPPPGVSLPIFWGASSAAVFPPSPPPADWTVGLLGSVFAVCLDDGGNIYLGRFNGWSFNNPAGAQGSLAGSRNTSIIKLATGGPFGVSSVFCSLPDPNPPLPAGSPDSSPGVGDVTFDCASGTLYASHLSDGRIYRIDSAGVIKGWYKHATDALSTAATATALDCGPGCAPGPCCDARYRDFAPLGDRVWALKVRNGRLYYSTWGEDLGVSAAPNRIWSIALNGSGDFVAGTRRQELAMISSPPVSDIDFAEDCKMVLAQRGMSGPTSFQPHQGRLLEYAPTSTGGWTTTSNYNGGNGFVVGSAGVHNSAGGVAIDRAAAGSGACTTVAGRYWVTADAIILNQPSAPKNVYGIQGISLTTPALPNSISIDYDNDTNSQDKGHQGDVEIACPECAVFTDEQRILCPLPPALTYPYLYTFRITNNSPAAVRYLFFSDIHIEETTIVLPVPLAPGQTSGPITLHLGPYNQLPAGQFCFDVTLADELVSTCCLTHHCIDIPNCDCIEAPRLEVACTPVPGTVNLTFSLDNLGLMFINEVRVLPPIGSGVAAHPDYYLLPTAIPPFGNTGPLSTTITGATPGTQLCLRFSIHLDGQECCSDVRCFIVPFPCPNAPPPLCTPGALCYADCDGSGAVNVQDFACFLNHYAAQDPCANCDGSTTPPTLNVQDFACFLNAFAAGCP